MDFGGLFNKRSRLNYEKMIQALHKDELLFPNLKKMTLLNLPCLYFDGLLPLVENIDQLVQVYNKKINVSFSIKAVLGAYIKEEPIDVIDYICGNWEVNDTNYNMLYIK